MIRAVLGDMGTAVDPNSFKSLAATIFMGVVGPAVFIVQPGFVQGLVEHIGLTDVEAGYVASAEMWGIAITTVIMTFGSHKVNWRHVFAVSLLIMIAGNIMSTTTTDFESFRMLRILTGLGAGGIVSLSFAAIGLTDDPDRNFGYLIMWVLIYGAIALLAMPTAYALVGMTGVLWFFAIFAACALPVVRFLPMSGETRAQVEADAINLPQGLKAVALVAMLSYFLAQGVVWAYLFLIGVAAGVTEQNVANGLTISQFLGIAGAFTAAMLGNRIGRSAPLTLGILAGATSLLFIIGEFDFLVYAVAVGVYNYAWNMVHPFLLASMASFDRRGRVVVYAVAMQMIGLAIGPYLAATVISEGVYANVNGLGIALFLLSLFLILPPVLIQARRAAVDPAQLGRTDGM